MTEYDINYREEIKKHKDFWESVLGKELCEDPPVDLALKKEKQMEDDLSAIETLYQEELLSGKSWDAYCLPGLFHKFYGFFGTNDHSLKSFLRFRYHSLEWQF